MFVLSGRPTIQTILWSGLSILFLNLNAQPSPATRLGREINEIIQHEQPINFEVVPGALIGIYIGDSTYVFSVGQAPEKNAIFELGSLTKPVVAYLASRIQADQHINIEESICYFLPDTLCQGKWQQVTLGQLLQHSCGLPKVTPQMAKVEDKISDPYAAYEIADLAMDVDQLTPVPGQYSYAHLNYMILHWLFEYTGGVEMARKKYLEETWGLHSMRYEVPDSAITAGHGMNGAQRLPWHTKAMAPAIGLKSNITDMLQFVRSIAALEAMPDLTKTLKRDLNAKAKKDIYQTHLGWFLVPNGNELMCFHTGHTGGHHTSVAFLPKRKVGVAVFSNGAAGSSHLSIRLLAMIWRAKK